MPSFHGEARASAVDFILAEYDRVISLSEPRWVSVTAPSGWGKTRLVQEFYRRLAMRQGDEAYWPANLLSSDGVQAAVASRKQLSAPFTHLPKSIPTYLWWGITCSLADSLVGDFASALSNLGTHAPYLDQAWWKLASASQRAERAMLGLRREVVKEGANDAVAAGLQTVTGAEPLGLGLAWWLGSRASELVSHRRTARHLVASDEEIAVDSQAIVTEAIGLLNRIGSVGLPIVIAIEDAHLLDVATARLLERVMMLNVPCLVITTQTQVVGQSVLAHSMWSREDRVQEIAAAGTSRSDFYRTMEIPLLTQEERASIANDCFEHLNADIAENLAIRYQNPLALMLFCGLPRHEISSGRATVAPTLEEIEAAPVSVKDMYRLTWTQLSPGTRLCLHLGTRISPRGVASVQGFDRSWDLRLLGAVASATGIVGAKAVDSAIESVRGQWIVNEAGLVSFLEEDQYDIAREDDDLLASSKVDRALEELARITQLAFANPLPLSSATWLLSQTAIALHMSGFSVGDETLANAGVTLVVELVGQSAELELAESVSKYMVASLKEGHFGRAALVAHSRALASLGRPDEAASELRKVLGRTTLLEGASPEERTVILTDLSSALHESGAYADAIDILELVLTETRPGGNNLRAYVTARTHLAMAFHGLGDNERALQEIEALVNSNAFATLEDETAALIARGAYADILRDSGAKSRALEIRQEVSLALQEKYGSEHPLALIARSNAAAMQSEQGDESRANALIELESLVRIRSRVSGPVSGAALGTRANFADALDLDGQHRRAVVEHRQVVKDSIRTLGSKHPLTLTRRNNLAISLSDRDNFDAAIGILEELISDMEEVLGKKHPRTRASTRALADLKEIARDYSTFHSNGFGQTWR